MGAPRILNELKLFLFNSVLLHPEAEELVVKWYVGKIVEQNLTIISGFPACILSILDEAMIPYDSVFELVAPYSVVVVRPELAEKIIDTMGKAESAPLFISTCYIGERCVFHVYNAKTLDLDFVAKHIVILNHVNDLITEYMIFGKCNGENLAEAYMNCMKQLAGELADIAKRRKDERLARILSDPFKVYCTPDIVIRHGQL